MHSNNTKDDEREGTTMLLFKDDPSFVDNKNTFKQHQG